MFKDKPPMKGITTLQIHISDKANQDIVEFLDNIDPQARLHSFKIMSPDSQAKRIYAGSFNSILSVTKRVKKEVIFYTKQMTGSQFAELFHSCSHLIGSFGLFNSSLINMECFQIDPEITYHFKELYINGAVRSKEDWDILADQLSQTNLKESLETIYVNFWYKNTAKKALFGFKARITNYVV